MKAIAYVVPYLIETQAEYNANIDMVDTYWTRQDIPSSDD